MLQKKAVDAQSAEQQATERDQQQETGRTRWTLPDFGGGSEPRQPVPRNDDRYRQPAPRQRTSTPRPSNRQTVAEAAIKSVVRSVGSSVGRAIVRGILGSLKKGF